MTDAEVRRLADGLEGTEADLIAFLQAHFMAELTSGIKCRLFWDCDLARCPVCKRWIRIREDVVDSHGCLSDGGSKP